MNEDGTMAKRPELETFAEKHGIKLGTIADLIRYRTINDKTIEMVENKIVTTTHGDFTLKTYTDNISHSVHYALVKGDIHEEEPCLVRVQTLNTLRDTIGTIRPGFQKSWSLDESMARIAEEGKGVVVIVDQERSKPEELEQMHWFPEMPPLQRVNTESGVYRVIGTGSQILRDLGVGKMRVLGMPTRYNALSGFSLEVVEFVENDT